MEISNHRIHQSGWVLFWAALLFANAFTTLLINLLPYATHYLHFSHTQGYQLYFLFIIIYYAVNLLGGILGTFFEYKRVLITGALLSIAGLVTLSLDDQLYAGLACFVSGSGLIHANLYALANLLLKDQPSKRERSILTIFIGVNLGTLGGLLTASTTSTLIGYSNSFLLAALTSLMATFIFIYGHHKHLPNSVKTKVIENKFKPKPIFLLILSIFLITYLVHTILNYTFDVKSLILPLWLGIFLVFVACGINKRVNLKKYASFILLMLTSALYWMLFGAFALTTHFLVPKQIGNFLQIGELTNAFIDYALDASWGIIIGLVILGIFKNSTRAKSLSFKTFIALLIATTAIVVWLLCFHFLTNTHYHLPFIIIVVLYCLLIIPEIILMPAIISTIIDVIPNPLQSSIIGAFFCMMGFSWSLLFLFDSPVIYSLFSNHLLQSPAPLLNLYEHLLIALSSGTLILGIILAYRHYLQGKAGLKKV